MVGRRLSVRTTSRLIAGTTAAVVIGLVQMTQATPPRVGVGDGGLTIGVVLVRPVTIAAAPPPVMRAPMAARPAPAPPASAPASGDGGGVRLWWDGPAGEIVFRSADRFERCRLARMERREEPDCPGQGETREMLLAEVR